MTYTRYVKLLAALLLGASTLVPVFAFAELNSANINAGVNANVNAGTNAGGVNARANATLSATTTARMERARERAVQEISRRIELLTRLNTRMGSVAKLSDQFKANLNTNVQNQIAALTQLKAGIEAESDLDILRGDVQSIKQSYRVFALVMPQTNIAAAADRMATIINMMIGLGSKLQARVQELQGVGADVTNLVELLNNMASELSGAQTQAQAAVTATATLTPDNGDADQAAANQAALKEARDDLHAAQQGLVAARKDVTDLLKGIREISAGVSASGEATTTDETP